MLLLSAGHRPFLLLAGLFSTLALAVWVGALHGVVNVSPSWHGHEMVFGFAAIAQAGFLSAAVANWTGGRRSLKGLWLALVIILWLAGRGAVWFETLLWLDILFLPVFSAFIATDIIQAKNWRNIIVPIILLIQGGLNGAYHYGDPEIALSTTVLVITAMIALIGGRVVPAFTRNALRAAGDAQADCPTYKWVGRASVPLILLTALTEYFHPGQSATGWVALVTGVVLLLQMSRWQAHKTLKTPIVWVLQAGFVWLPIGYLLKATSDFGGPVEPTQALHALTTGAIGVMIVAVASRAIRGHSGRPLIADMPTVAAYILIIAAAVARVAFPGDGALQIAGVLWVLGYGLFAIVHAPMLLKPRLDGKPG